ncbi:MAG TPA: FUSC family protein, partial [Acidimicrobiales bacterium]
MRTGTVTVAGFAIGRWGMHSVSTAVFATFTALAITGIADFGGSLLGRSIATTVSTAFGVGLAALGTWVSMHSVWIQCLLIFGVGAVVSLGRLLGGYAAAGANAVILFYLVAAGSPAKIGTVPDRVEGVAVGGALALVAGLVLWPAPAQTEALRQLGGALKDLAERLGALAGQVRSGGLADGSREPGDHSLGVRAVIDDLSDRPAEPTRSARGELYLLNDLERLGGLVNAFESAPYSDHDRSVVSLCAEELRAVSAALIARSGHDLKAPNPPVALSGLPQFGVVARLWAVTEATSSHAAAALGSRRAGKIIDAFTAQASSLSGWDDVTHGIRRFVANLSPRSVYLQDALRVGVGLAVATAAVKAFSLQRGFWVAFATLTVVKSNVRATERSVGQAVSGTTAGFALATAIIALFATNTNAYLVLLPVVIATAIYANVAISFLAGQAGFTVAIIVLFNLLGPAGWRIGIVRIEDVVAGGLVGLAVGSLIWPRGASATVAPAVADLLDDASTYLAETVHHLADPRSSQTSVVGAPDNRATESRRNRAMSTAVRAENSFAQFLAEDPTPDDATRWSTALATANRLWYAADLIHAARPARSADLDDVVDRLEERYRSAAHAIRNRRPVPSTARTPRSATDIPDDGLVEWLEELTDAPLG